MFKRAVFVALLFLLAVQVVVAHDVWIVKRNGDLVLMYGHGEKHDPYNPESIKDVKAFDVNRKTVPVEIVKHRAAASLAPKGTAAILALFFDAGYWAKTTEGWKETTRRAAKGQYELLLSQKSEKCAKAVLRPSDAWSKPAGLRLEILPQKDPTSVQPGDVLPITVLFEGKPVEGARIRTGAAGDSAAKDVLKTDQDGNASVPILKPGFQTIFASHKTPLKDDPDADVLSLSTSLTFEAK